MLDRKSVCIHILSYHQSAISSRCPTQTHKNYSYHRRTTMRWFSWEPTGRRSSPARWLHLRLKWLCTVSIHRWKWQLMGRRSLSMSRRASPSIGLGLIMLELCTVWPVWATWGRALPSTCSSMLTVSAAAQSSVPMIMTHFNARIFRMHHTGQQINVFFLQVDKQAQA